MGLRDALGRAQENLGFHGSMRIAFKAELEKALAQTRRAEDVFSSSAFKRFSILATAYVWRLREGPRAVDRTARMTRWELGLTG